jgi:NAD(P)-dependent dehydrogenase (short-subunit alcohol dehydrogenase family)
MDLPYFVSACSDRRFYSSQILLRIDYRYIINISSVARIKPMPNSSVYAASKNAVDWITRVIAHVAVFPAPEDSE